MYNLPPTEDVIVMRRPFLDKPYEQYWAGEHLVPTQAYPAAHVGQHQLAAAPHGALSVIDTRVMPTPPGVAYPVQNIATAHTHHAGPIAARAQDHLISRYDIAAHEGMQTRGVAARVTHHSPDIMQTAMWGPSPALTHAASSYQPPSHPAHYPPPTSFAPVVPPGGYQRIQRHPNPAHPVVQGPGGWAMGQGRRERDVPEVQTTASTTTGSLAEAAFRAGQQAPPADINRSNNGWDEDDVQLTSGSLQTPAAGQHTPWFRVQDDPMPQVTEVQAEEEIGKEEGTKRQRQHQHQRKCKRRQATVKQVEKKSRPAKEFWCNSCDLEEPFADKGGLTRHDDAKHQGIRFFCPECAEDMSRPFLLARHGRRKHKWIKNSAQEEAKVEASKTFMKNLQEQWKRQQSDPKSAVTYEWTVVVQNPKGEYERRSLCVVWSPPPESRLCSK